MRHPRAVPLGLLLFLVVQPAIADGKKWTHGRSVCDPVGRQLIESGLSPVDSAALEKAWEYSLQDVELLGELKCFGEAGRAATEIAARLRTLEGQVIPGFHATACSASPEPAAARMTKVGDSLGGLRGSEAFFEDTLARYDGLQASIAAEIPAGGLPFDDCRAKAQRGWARARASLNKLSCEVSQSLDRLEAFRDRAAQGAGVAALECAAAVPLAQAPAAAQAPAVLLAAPVVGYQAFPGDGRPLPSEPVPATGR